MAQALIDTDVLLKTASYGLLTLLTQSKPFGASEYAMLGAAKYVVQGRLKKKLTGQDLTQAKEHFAHASQEISEIEPTEEEIRLAALLEGLAMELGVDFDTGESQLSAVLISRGCPLLMTGDKRAITAIGELRNHEACTTLIGRVACLEQTILWMTQSAGLESVQPPVCRLKQVDSSLTMSFGCYSGGAPMEACMEGLSSYIKDLHAKAPGVLISYPE